MIFVYEKILCAHACRQTKIKPNFQLILERSFRDFKLILKVECTARVAVSKHDWSLKTYVFFMFSRVKIFQWIRSL